MELLASPLSPVDAVVSAKSRVSEADSDHLVKIIGALPAKLRSAFVMRHIEQKSEREVAEALGISVRQVRKRLTQALIRCHHGLEARRIESALE
jgi:RNA polymerase sigma factor (sigma-70 family)